MDATIQRQLHVIGSLLDQNIYPEVRNGGIVTPSNSTVLSTLGAENHDENTRRSTTRPREGPPRGEGTAGRSWPAHRTSPLVGAGLQTQYEAELSAVYTAYPATKAWLRNEGLWLLSESSILSGLKRAAIFLCGVSYADAIVRGWAFWKQSSVDLSWIGPRHTNFPDGSICAFHAVDGTWLVGDSLVKLLDLYSLWALRHLYFETFGRWPGKQAVIHPYERILELRSDEYCGCEKSEKLYSDCCQPNDRARNQIADAVNFVVNFRGGRREPPGMVMQSIRSCREPPPLHDILS